MTPGDGDGTVDPTVLELSAATAYEAGDLEGAVSAWERIYAVHLTGHDDLAAAQAAATVALMLLCDTGLLAPVRGWARRAQDLLGDAPPCPAHALIAIVRAYERLLAGEPDAARGWAADAVELGERFGVGPAQGLGRVAVARLAIHDGEMEQGLELLDGVAVDLAMGVFDPLTTGNVYCELICAAQWVGRYDKARDWTETMERWRHGTAIGPSHGRCRVHRAELLRLTGPAAAAELEALGACDDLHPWMRREYGWPLVELGNIRLRRGDLAGAEEVFLAAHERAWSPQPGLALLRLAQGDVGTAAAMLASELDHPSQVPWKERPPFGGLRLVPLLAAQAEVAWAAADASLAITTAARLAEIRDRYPSQVLAAQVALAEAVAALLAGADDAAVEAAGTAVATWVELGAPYDAAMARLVLGDALRAGGHTDAARMEWQAALTAYDGYGAPLGVAAAGRRLAGDRAVASAAADPVAELRYRGSHWLLLYGGAEVVLPALKGLGYLARLLAEPGREIAATELAGAGTAEAPMPMLDHEARAAYRRRLVEVDEDLDEAARDHDEARRAIAERDRDFLMAELRHSVGLAGRVRSTGGTAERARTAVTRSLRYALTRVCEAQPELGGHLAGAVRTGTWCSYVPDPLALVEWKVD